MFNMASNTLIYTIRFAKQIGKGAEAAVVHRGGSRRPIETEGSEIKGSSTNC